MASGDAGGSLLPSLEQQLIDINGAIDSVTIKIDAALTEAAAATSVDDRAFYRGEVVALRKDKDRLRKDKDRLREEKLLLLRLQPRAARGSDLETISENLETVVKVLIAVAPTLNLFSKAQLAKYAYTIGKASRESRNADFRRQLLKNYEPAGSLVGQGHARCAVIGKLLPNVIASHLFKHEWRDDVEDILGFSDIDSPRNGLLLYKPIEWAFDSSRLVILPFAPPGPAPGPSDAGSGLWVHVLEPALSGKLLCEKAKERLGQDYLEPADLATKQMTFGDLHGQPLTFETDHRPYLRCLNFQARQARTYALRQRWITADWDFPDFWSDTCYAATMLDNFLEQQLKSLQYSDSEALVSEDAEDAAG